ICVQPRRGAAVAAWTGCARLCPGQRPGADIAAEAVGGSIKVEAENFGVKLASLGSIPETEHVRDRQEIAAPEKLKEREAIVFIRPRSAEAGQQVFGQALETGGATAAAGCAPSVADGQASGGSKGVSVWDGISCVIYGQTL